MVPYKHRIVVAVLRVWDTILEAVALTGNVVLQGPGDVVGVTEVEGARQINVVQDGDEPGFIGVLFRLESGR